MITKPTRTNSFILLLNRWIDKALFQIVQIRFLQKEKLKKLSKKLKNLEKPIVLIS